MVMSRPSVLYKALQLKLHIRRETELGHKYFSGAV